MTKHHRLYPTELPNEEWALLEPSLDKHVYCGRPPKWPRRLIADAIFYLLRSGCPWRLLPREYPPWRTVDTQFRRWRISGTFHDTHERLRCSVRGVAGRAEEPSATAFDSQTARTTGVGGPARGSTRIYGSSSSDKVVTHSSNVTARLLG
jgi:putative transposase